MSVNSIEPFYDDNVQISIRKIGSHTSKYLKTENCITEKQTTAKDR